MVSFQNYPCYSCDEKEICDSRCDSLNEWYGNPPEDPYDYEEETARYTEYVTNEYIRKVTSELNFLSDDEFKEMYYIEKDSFTNDDISHIAFVIMEKDEVANEMAFGDNFKDAVKDLAIKKMKDRIRKVSKYYEEKNKNIYERLSRQ